MKMLKCIYQTSVAVWWWAFGKMEPGVRHQEVGEVFGMSQRHRFATAAKLFHVCMKVISD